VLPRTGVRRNEGTQITLDTMSPYKPDPKPEPRQKKKRKRIAVISESRKLDNKLYKQAREEYLADFVMCQRCNNKFSQEIHHKCGRISSMLYNKRYFFAVCRACHVYIHDNVAESMEEGWLATKLGKK